MTRNMIEMDDTQSDSALIYLARGCSDPEEIATLQREVIARGDAREMYDFAEHIRGADVHALGEAVIATGDHYMIEAFVRDITGADIMRMEEALDAIEEERRRWMLDISSVSTLG